jgi:acyl-CoA thioester hydrolase
MLRQEGEEKMIRIEGIPIVAARMAEACKAGQPADITGRTLMSEFTITYRGTVYPWQCDHIGHMNVMWYTGKFDEASWQLLSTLGLTGSRFRKDGTGMAAVEQHIEYKRELCAGDLVTVRSSVLEVREKSIRLIHEMRNDETGEVAATAVIVGVHLDTRSRRSRPLPPGVRERAVAAQESA